MCFFQPRRNTESPDDKLKKREQAKIRSAMKQRESKRLRMAQSIQRELEETAVKQADLEREGVVVEKALRSGGGEYPSSLSQQSNQLMGQLVSPLRNQAVNLSFKPLSCQSLSHSASPSID